MIIWDLNIRNLLKTYLKPGFRLYNDHLNFLPAHTNLNGYCVPKNRFETRLYRCTYPKNNQIWLKKDNKYLYKG